MAWTNRLVNARVYRSKNTLDIEDVFPAYGTITFYFEATRNGVIRVNSYYNNNYYPTKMFVSDSYTFDDQTGEPTSYIAYTTGRTVDCNIIKGRTYYVLLKGNTSRNLPFHCKMYYTSAAYEPYLMPAIDPFITTDNTAPGYDGVTRLYTSVNDSWPVTEIYPIKFTYPATVWLWSDDLTNVAATTTNTGINVNTGMPLSTDISVNDPDTSASVHKKFDAAANTQYYLYVVGYGNAGSWLNIEAMGTQVSFGSEPIAEVYDQFGRLQRSYNCIPKHHYHNSGTSTVFYQGDSIGVNSPFVNGFFSDWTYQGITYKWAKFIGWWDNPSFTGDPLNISPFTMGVTVCSGDNQKIYGLVQLVLDDFTWYTTKNSGDIFRQHLTAQEWNDFCDYAQSKTTLAHTGGDSRHVQSGDYFTAEIFNRAKVTGSSLPDVARGDIIYASYFTTLLNEVNGDY